MLVKHI